VAGGHSPPYWSAYRETSGSAWGYALVVIIAPRDDNCAWTAHARRAVMRDSRGPISNWHRRAPNVAQLSGCRQRRAIRHAERDDYMCRLSLRERTLFRGAKGDKLVARTSLTFRDSRTTTHCADCAFLAKVAWVRPSQDCVQMTSSYGLISRTQRFPTARRQACQPGGRSATSRMVGSISRMCDMQTTTPSLVLASPHPRNCQP